MKHVFLCYLQLSIIGQEFNEESGEQKVYQELSTRLLSIAKQHEGYSTLWNICCDLNDTVLLKTLMVRI